MAKIRFLCGMHGILICFEKCVVKHICHVFSEKLGKK